MDPNDPLSVADEPRRGGSESWGGLLGRGTERSGARFRAAAVALRRRAWIVASLLARWLSRAAASTPSRVALAGRFATRQLSLAAIFLNRRFSIAWRFLAPRLSSAISALTKCVRFAWSLRAVRISAAVLIAFVVLTPSWAAYHVYFDRTRLPDIEPFIQFEPPGIGEVYDVHGAVLIELAREYRRVVTYDEVPFVVREAVLAAEDKSFFSHSGVDYTALPRVIHRTATRTLSAWWNGKGMRLRLPQGGSTLTQQLVRAYFLRERTSQQGGNTLYHDGVLQRMLALGLGVPATNKLLRKLEEVRLSLWLEEEMCRRYGTKDRAKREIFARSASFHYVGNGRYGLAAGSDFYFRKPLASFTVADAAKAAALAGIAKSPRDYAPTSTNLRSLRRRNQILDLMARNGSIPAAVAHLCQAEPLPMTAPSLRKTEAPSVIGHVFDEVSDRGGREFGIEDLFQGRISVHSTVDEGLQSIATLALENGLARYETRHPTAQGQIQGSVVALRNWDAAVLAEVGGRKVYKDRGARYSDLNRVTGSLRQPGSAWKPIVYLAAFRLGLNLETTVPDAPIGVHMGVGRDTKWIANYDRKFVGEIPIRRALAQSRNAVAVWITREIGLGEVIRTARDLGIHSPVQPYVTSALGASEVRLLELADAYRAMASGTMATPHIIHRVTDASGELLYEAAPPSKRLGLAGLSLIQEGLRGVVRMPDGTAHSLDRSDFPIPVMGKTGTTSSFRDALFVGSTYGPQGITVAVRVGFDDNRGMGPRETGGRVALPIFREILLRAYEEALVGPAPRFPREIERGIDNYLALQASADAAPLLGEDAPPSFSGADRSMQSEGDGPVPEAPATPVVTVASGLLSSSH